MKLKSALSKAIGFFFIIVFNYVSADMTTVTVSRVVSVYDGDTIKVDIDQWPDIIGDSISVRVRGIDTPEIRGKCESEKKLAITARDFVRKTLEDANQVRLENIVRGKYFRLVADVYIDNSSLGELIIKEGVGRPYDGEGSRTSWCGVKAN